MSLKGNKFGAFKGVFTPSILTILGVIMYLRLPWIIGQAGLWATLGIILVAHIISVTTGLSVASIATDKKVETGGTYYMISRSLGLPIGGTLGLALFVGLSFSISLYIIGFSETLLTAFGLEVTLNTIRLTGAITLLIVTIVSFISTNLALKTQFLILGVMVLSIASILLGQHEFVPKSPLSGSAVNSLPWIALFAIFFPAVQGFEAGVSMSGDLANPKKALPIGTISAILVGFVVYIGLVFFFSYTVERDALLNDSSVLLNISLYSPIVIAGIWGATLSSAFGGLLGAPRILQATAMDRITPKTFAKGVGAGNEPRNALLLTFIIAFAGIMIGELNVIARVVSTFFIITYGFLNLTCAIENWAGSDFRPSFRIPAWISIIGAIACFVVMIQLDFAAMVGATILLGAVFLFLKRKELRLQSGDTWGGIWSSIVKYGLFKLSLLTSRNQRNWRPNIILFSGGVKARPHLIDLGRTLVGKQGVFTNFELLEAAENDKLFTAPARASTEVDHRGKSIITRKHTCNNVYDGMQMIAKVYGFTGFEPNTILMGWAKDSRSPQKFCETAQMLSKLDYNLVFYTHHDVTSSAKPGRIDLWWNGNSRNLNFGLSLLKYITTDNAWRSASVRLLIINYNSAKTDSIYALANQALDNSRLLGSVKVINNAVEKISEEEIVKRESSDAGLAILESNISGYSDPLAWVHHVGRLVDLPCSSVVIEANSGFEVVNVFTIPDTKPRESTAETLFQEVPLVQSIQYPRNELLAGEIQKNALRFEQIQGDFITNSVLSIQNLFNGFHEDVTSLCSWFSGSVEKGISLGEQSSYQPMVRKALAEFSFQSKSKLQELANNQLTVGYFELEQAVNTYLISTKEALSQTPDKMLVGFSKAELKSRRTDSFRIRLTKSSCIAQGAFLGWPMNRKVEVGKALKLFLLDSRLEDFSDFFTQFGIASFRYLSNIRKIMFDLAREVEKPSQNEKLSKSEIDRIRQEYSAQLADAFEEYSKSNQQNTSTLNSSLIRGFQRLSMVLGKPESSLLLRPYRQLIAKQDISTDSLQSAPTVWHSNLKLFASKVHVEYMIDSLRHRFDIKISKLVDELNSWTKSNPLKSIESARVLLNEMKTTSEVLDISPLLKRMGDIAKPSMHGRFEDLFREVNELIADLPEQVNFNSDTFYNELEIGHFVQSDVRTLNLRKKVEFYVGMEFVSKARVSMETVSDSLKGVSDRLKSKIRLAAFNIENLIQQDDGQNQDSGSFVQMREKLLKDLLKELDLEEQKVITLLHDFEKDFKHYLLTALEPVSQYIHGTSSSDTRLSSKAKKRVAFVWLANLYKSIGSFANRQLVTILYSQSEGIMLAQKLTRLNKKKLSTQAVHDVLTPLSGSKEVLKKIPFYYANLFSGSTTLNRELWIERPYEQQMAEQITSRFKSGHSGALLITGHRNSGKTTLSKYVAKVHFPKHNTLLVKAPLGGSASKELFMETLKKTLKTEGEVDQMLNSSPSPLVIIINDLELWWERHDDGLEVLRFLIQLVEKYGSKHFFIINCNAVAYELINRIVRIDSILMGHIDCQPFDAKEIKELVMTRHRTGGLTLMLNGKSEGELTEWNFARLFNRYFNITIGNPGYSLQLWLRSITRITNKTIYLKIPETPNFDSLRDLPDEVWMVILQLVIHRRTTLDRLSRILRLTVNQAEDMVREQIRTGIIEERFPGVFAVNSTLEPYLFNLLKEKELC